MPLAAAVKLRRRNAPTDPIVMVSPPAASLQTSTLPHCQAAFAAITGQPGRQAALRRLLRELADLKRVRSAAFEGTFAEHRFAVVWQSLCRCEQPEQLREICRSLAWEEAARAITATRLSAMTADSLAILDIDAAVIERTLRSAIAQHTDVLEPELQQRLQLAAASITTAAVAHVRASSAYSLSVSDPPECIKRLNREPRAGATAPDKSRALVVPQESHADHCYITAVIATVFSELFTADAGDCFLIAISHHLHNAYLPDAGFAGEMLLEDALLSVISAARAKAIADLPPILAQACREAVPVMGNCDTPAGAAVNAADSIDRLLQVEFHAAQSSFTAATAIVELDIVHAGPLQKFQNDFAKLLKIGQVV